MTKSVQASDGDAYHVHAISDIASIASEIFSPKQILPVCDETENVSREVLALRLYKMSSRALKFSRENAAFLQSSFAKMGRFVNQHMSLIALETEQQKKDLERYSRYDSRYDTSYENFDTYDDGNSGFLRVQSAVMENTTSLSFGENFRDQIVGGSVSTTGGPTVSTTGGSTSSPVSVGAVGYGIGILFLIVGVVQAVRHYRREMDVDVSKQEN